MFYLMDYSADVKFLIYCAIGLAILFGILCIVAVIEAIEERREQRRKRYTVQIRPTRRY